MCAVIGYIGKSLCSTFIFEGLARLEYRGYDSAGFACIEPVNQKLLYSKAAGQLLFLAKQVKQNPIDGFLGIGHTRWSTHGDISERNAHPHFDCSGTISVVHNGIIENYDILKSQLLQLNHVFQSDTDTEVISHLFESIALSIEIAPDEIGVLAQKLQGAYAFVIMLQKFPNVLIAVRKKSPLYIGIGNDEMFVASDVLAFAGKTDTYFFLPDESFAFVYKNSVKVYDFAGNELSVTAQTVATIFEHIDKNGYEHFMLKEIYEQNNAITATIKSLRDLEVGLSLFDQLGITAQQLASLQHIVLLACGSSWHAARIAQFFFESIAHIPVTVHLASEFRYTSFFPQDKALYIVISQSGETADTLEALRLINIYNLPTIALTNVATSTIIREAHGYLLTHAGFEVAVASTKAFSTQLTVLYWFAYRIALEKKIINYADLFKAEEDLLRVAQLLEDSLKEYTYRIDTIDGQRYASYDKALFLGRHISYPLAMEGALKLKEIAYVFAESYPAGELKHGSLALVDTTMLIYIFSHGDPVIYQKILSNAHEVKARGGRIIAFAYSGQNELCSLAETSFIVSSDVPPLLGPLAMLGIMQYFIYTIARLRGCPIDKPRNLAKSVTVE
ncbi:MAG TPA: glutamine--fructose-6-phosphate transaminase (isomerizing) [Candidatus Babeliales bacterium]|nr:glutamine--fructose-6-phosphate transaminase (isomerizing) [Candidatus Babeliales bacterium]